MTRLWVLVAWSVLFHHHDEMSGSISVCDAFQLSIIGPPRRSNKIRQTSSRILVEKNAVIIRTIGLSSSSCLHGHSNDDIMFSSSCDNNAAKDQGYCRRFPSQNCCMPTAQHQPSKNRSNNIFTAAIVTLMLACSFFLHPLPTDASSYYALTDEQKTVAEAWRLVDNSFLDRTFNHQDWFKVRQTYVNSKKYKTMDNAHAAIAEMVQSLGDPYTRYLSPGQYQSLVDAATGTFAGVGVEISQSKDPSTRYIYASDVQKNSPAERAGIRPNDKFRRVGNLDLLLTTAGSSTTTTTTTVTPDDVAVQLRGPPGSKVGVTMERPDGSIYDVILTREPLTIAAVQSYVLPTNGKVGVIRIKNFSGTTADKVKEEWIALQKKGTNILVLDVRGNPGGLLPGGVDTASLFLPENVPLVYVVNKLGIVDAQATLSTGMFANTPSLPLIVVVDANTASAAEVMTAALQDNGRAIVVGQQTFGKGIVQTVRELSHQQGGVAITVARYETPLHKDINQQGIAVSVEAPVDCPKDNIATCLPPNVFQALTKLAVVMADGTVNQ